MRSSARRDNLTFCTPCALLSDEPVLDSESLAGRVAVEHEVNGELPRHLVVDALEELLELDRPVLDRPALYTGRSPAATVRVLLSTAGSIRAGSRVTTTSTTTGTDCSPSARDRAGASSDGSSTRIPRQP